MPHTWDTHFDALVFDCDGVILDSASLKRGAFADFYQEEPEPFRSAILAYLARGGGQPRDVKFQHIEAHILGRPVTNKRIRTLSRKFAERIEAQVAESPAIPGALEFLQRWQGKKPCYLLSATPQIELRRVIEQRGLTDLFDDVVGAPPNKVNGLLNLITRHQYSSGRIVMIGDSYNDYRAARSNSTHFLGVLPDNSIHSPFPANTIVIPNLHNLETALEKLAHVDGYFSLNT